MLYDQNAIFGHVCDAIVHGGAPTGVPRRRNVDPGSDAAWLLGDRTRADDGDGLVLSSSFGIGDGTNHDDVAVEPSAGSRRVAVAPARRAGPGGVDTDDGPRPPKVAGRLRRLLVSRGRRTSPAGRELPHRILDALPDAILLCDARGAIRYRNRAAGQMIADEGAVIRDVGGALHTPPRERQEFLRALVQAIEHGLSTRIAIDGLAPGRHVVRVDPDGGDERTALVTIRNIPSFVSGQGETAAQAWGFTPAETALAINLLKGLTVEQHAAERSLRISTVRSQLCALFAKTDTQRQGQLISLLLTDAPYLDMREGTPT